MMLPPLSRMSLMNCASVRRQIQKNSAMTSHELNLWGHSGFIEERSYQRSPHRQYAIRTSNPKRKMGSVFKTILATRSHLHLHVFTSHSVHLCRCRFSTTTAVFVSCWCRGSESNGRTRTNLTAITPQKCLISLRNSMKFA